MKAEGNLLLFSLFMCPCGVMEFKIVSFLWSYGVMKFKIVSFLENMTHNCKPGPSFDAPLGPTGYHISCYINVMSY